MKKRENITSKLEAIELSTLVLLFLFAFICISVLIIHYLLLQPIKFFRYWLLQSIEFFRSRWEKLGKYGRIPFLVLITFLLVLIFHDLIFPRFALFFIKKASSEQAIVMLGLFALILICLSAATSYYLTISTYYFSQVSIKCLRLFYDKINEPFHQNKDRIDHSFRTVDAILKYFGVVATLLAGIGFMINYVNSQETAKTDREKMLNELFYKAIEQVGSSDTSVNLAGIYSLEQSAINSPKNQWKVVGLLANYIRQHRPEFDEKKLLGKLTKEYNDRYKRKSPNNTINTKLEEELLKTGKNDGRWLAPYKKKDARVQAALGAICRRKLEHDKDLFESIHDKYNEITEDDYSSSNSNRIIDLTTDQDLSTIVSDLSNYDMSGCNFHRVSLNRATLHNANMTNADLSKGYLFRASLVTSNLVKADLEKSDLTEANLSFADLSSADLHQAKMKQAKLTMANLTGTNLSGAYDLNKDQIRKACYWRKATYNPQQEKELEINIDIDIESSDRPECKKKWEPKAKKTDNKPTTK
jgi:uncharacterized short protein YbdD (DUF466 family)